MTPALLLQALDTLPDRQRGEQAKRTEAAIRSVLDGTATPETTQRVERVIARFKGDRNGR